MPFGFIIIYVTKMIWSNIYRYPSINHLSLFKKSAIPNLNSVMKLFLWQQFALSDADLNDNIDQARQSNIEVGHGLILDLNEVSIHEDASLWGYRRWCLVLRNKWQTRYS